MSRAIKVFIFLPHVLLHELHMRHLRSHGTLHNCSFISSFGCIIWQILGCVDGTKLGRGNGQKSRETIRDMSRVCFCIVSGARGIGVAPHLRPATHPDIMTGKKFHNSAN